MTDKEVRDAMRDREFDIFAEMGEFLVIDKPNGAIYTVGMIEEELNGSLTAVCSCEECQFDGFGTIEELVTNLTYLNDHIQRREKPRALKYKSG